VISQAALSLAVLTLAAVIVVVSRQIESPVPAAWAGVVLAVFGLVLGIGQWSDLMRLGRTRLELDVTDYLGLLLATVGIVLIAVGGVMTALDQQAKKPAVPAGDPAAEPAGDAAADDAAVAADEVSPAG
jgi:di/tricarboxylate transporter